MYCYKDLSDCTSCYRIELDKKYTVNDFASAVLIQSPNSSGYIEIYRKYKFIGDPIIPCRYSKGNIITAFSDDILNKNVVKAEAHGGYGVLNYLIWIE